MNEGTDKFKPYIKEYDVPVKEQHVNHGTAVTGIILSDKGDDWVCPQVKITMCNFLPENTGNYYNCLAKALVNKYDYINMSMGEESYNILEHLVLKAVTKNTTVVVAAGNRKKNFKTFFPAALYYRNIPVIVVKNTGPTSNYGKGGVLINGENIPVWFADGSRNYMSGTSMSAARYTHRLLKERCKKYDPR